MAYKRKTWKEKLHDSKGLPKVVKIEGKLTKRWGTGTCAIAAPIEVDEMVRKVPKGKLITINILREKIAKKHKATIACPITTGIFGRIVAEAAEEDRRDGKKNITPWWRILKEGGELNPKYPPVQRKMLESDGHKIIKKGKKLVVAGYEKKLVK